MCAGSALEAGAFSFLCTRFSIDGARLGEQRVRLAAQVEAAPLRADLPHPFGRTHGFLDVVGADQQGMRLFLGRFTTGPDHVRRSRSRLFAVRAAIT